jgi:hypothetical protein
VKLYRITPAGRDRLAHETRQWDTFTKVVSSILLPASPSPSPSTSPATSQ